MMKFRPSEDEEESTPMVPIGTVFNGHRLTKILHYWARYGHELRYDIKCVKCGCCSTQTADGWLQLAVCPGCAMAAYLMNRKGTPELKMKTLERYKEHVRCATKHDMPIEPVDRYWRDIEMHPELADWEPIPKDLMVLHVWHSGLHASVQAGKGRPD